FRFWHTLKLRFFQQPILDIKCLLSWKGSIFADSFRSFHDIDRVDIKFSSNPRSLLIFRKSKHTHTWEQDDYWISIAYRRTIWMLTRLVILRIHRSVVFKKWF